MLGKSFFIVSLVVLGGVSSVMARPPAESKERAAVEAAGTLGRLKGIKETEWRDIRRNVITDAPEKYQKVGYSATNALAQALVIWNNLGIIDLDKMKRHQRETLLEVSHRQAASVFGSKISNARPEKMAKDLEAFIAGLHLSPELKPEVELRHFKDVAAELPKIAVGPNLCILTLNSHNRTGKRASHGSEKNAVFVVDGDLSGAITINTWGVIDTIIPVEKDHRGRQFYNDQGGKISEFEKQFSIDEDSAMLIVRFTALEDAN